MKFIKSNYIFVIWVIIYCLILLYIALDDLNSFFILLGIELASLIVAFSPVGEWILRTMSGARRIKTNKDKEYLLPLFNAVYEDALEYNSKLSRNVKLYIEKDKDINAYAFGSNSISVTRGAIDSLSEGELKGVIAHEFGHISNGDTKVALVMTIGNGAFTLLWLVLKFVMTRGKHKDDLQLVFLFNAVLAFIVSIFIAKGNRKNEYMADEFACEIGYGEGLLETLYFFKEINMGGKMKLAERLQSSHPDLDNRIVRIETFAETPRNNDIPRKQKVTVQAVKPTKKPVRHNSKVSVLPREITTMPVTEEHAKPQSFILAKVKTQNISKVLPDTAREEKPKNDVDVAKLEARIKKYDFLFDEEQTADIAETEESTLDDISAKIEEAVQLKERQEFWNTLGKSDIWKNI